MKMAYYKAYHVAQCAFLGLMHFHYGLSQVFFAYLWMK